MLPSWQEFSLWQTKKHFEIFDVRSGLQNGPSFPNEKLQCLQSPEGMTRRTLKKYWIKILSNQTDKEPIRQRSKRVGPLGEEKLLAKHIHVCRCRLSHSIMVISLRLRISASGSHRRDKTRKRKFQFAVSWKSVEKGVYWTHYQCWSRSSSHSNAEQTDRQTQQMRGVQ